jgi:hypothetical protein
VRRRVEKNVSYWLKNGGVLRGSGRGGLKKKAVWRAALRGRGYPRAMTHSARAENIPKMSIQKGGGAERRAVADQRMRSEKQKVHPAVRAITRVPGGYTASRTDTTAREVCGRGAMAQPAMFEHMVFPTRFVWAYGGKQVGAPSSSPPPLPLLPLRIRERRVSCLAYYIFRARSRPRSPLNTRTSPAGADAPPLPCLPPLPPFHGPASLFQTFSS